MKRFLVVAALTLLAGACSSAPYSDGDYSTNTPANESAAEHGGGPGPGDVPANPSATGH
jgi:hypothetical protein